MDRFGLSSNHDRKEIRNLLQRLTIDFIEGSPNRAGAKRGESAAE